MHRCRSQPCHNDGACVDLPGNFRCDCPRGFTGLLCEADLNECATAPCVNYGLCVNEVIEIVTTSNTITYTELRPAVFPAINTGVGTYM